MAKKMSERDVAHVQALIAECGTVHVCPAIAAILKENGVTEGVNVTGQIPLYPLADK